MIGHGRHRGTARVAAATAVAAAALCALVARGAPVSAPTGGARALLEEGERLRRSGAYRSARRVLEQACGLARAGNDAAAEIDTLAALARADDAMGDAATATRERDDALALAGGIGDRLREAALYADAGQSHARRAEHDEGARLLRRALAMQEAARDRAGEARTRSALAWLAYKEGRYADAFVDADLAVAMAGTIGDLAAAADARLVRGLVHLDRREYVAALADFQGSLAAAAEVGDLQRQVEALDHVAITFLFQHAPAEARATLDRALGLARSREDRALEMRVRHLLANALREAGRHHEAIAEYAAIGTWYESEGDLSEAAWVRYRAGRSQSALGRLEDAERSWRAALGLWQSLGERRAAAWAAYDLARLLERAGRPEDAIAAYTDAVAAQRAIDLPYVSLALGDLAFLLARAGRPEPARATAIEAVRAAEAVANPEMRWSSLYRRGQVERVLGRPADALDSFGAALDVIETLRTQVAPIDEARAGFMIGKQEAYATTVDLLVEMGRPGEALEVSERARARAFLDLIGGGREARTGAGQESGARADPDDAGPRRGAPAGGASANDGVPGAAPTPRPAADLAVPPLSLAGIRDEARRRRATILEYFTAPERSFVFAVVPAGEVRAAIIPRGAAALGDAVAALRRDLDAGLPAPAALRELHDLLVAPVAAALPDDPDRLVVVVPHGPLALLPFAALVDPGGDYFVERHTLACAPAAGALRLAAGRRGTGGPRPGARLLAVGNPLHAPGSAGGPAFPPLPGAEEEVRAVADLFRAGGPIVLTGSEATEARIRSTAPGRALLHFATHAIADDADPLASRLLLASASGRPGAADASDDGALTAGEIATLRLRADLVTLSACDTGLGGAGGEGIGGLSRAFLRAGAASLVVSLWRVADVAAREQMVRFYRAYGSDGLGPARALRRAQIETIRALRNGAVRGVSGRPLAESPALWAPFVVLGEPG